MGGGNYTMFYDTKSESLLAHSAARIYGEISHRCYSDPEPILLRHPKTLKERTP